MDELLYDGFWLEATDGSNFWQPGPTTPNNLVNSPSFPTSESNVGSENTNPYQESFLKVTSKSNLSGDPALSYVESDEFSASQSKRLWIGPNRNPIRTISVEKRLVQAIDCLKDSVRDNDVLIQIWIPVKRGGRQVLTTNNQPFSLNPHYKNLADYRDVSENYQFAADSDSKEFVGLPGRVFLNKLPEWTPMFASSKEKSIHVLTMRSSTMLEDHSHFRFSNREVAVNLKSSNILSPYNVEDHNEPYQDALTEIRNVLKFICDAHKLPLAQAWASCVQQRKGGCLHSDENYECCVSTIESACYVADAQVSGFHEACSGYHLLKAIRLRSTYNGADDFVLEFFLPLNCKDADDQKFIFDSLSPVVQQTCQSLRVITDQELVQETSERERGSTSAGKLDNENHPNLVASSTKEYSHDDSSWILSMIDPEHKGKGLNISLEQEFKVTTKWDNSELDSHHVPATLEQDQLQRHSAPERSVEDSGNFSLTIGHHHSSGAKTSSEKRRTKIKKTISLQVLRQYYAGSLKEAAMSIGVCPTTLKRICRQHGITRWPSRKIKKVGHSLRKLQLVINSVQGAEGSIQLNSFYNNFPELVSPNVPGSSSHLSTSKTSGHLQQVNNQPEPTTLFGPATTASQSPSSSGNHSSSSSYCCSTGVKQSSSFPVNGSSRKDALSSEQTGGMLKRAQSEAELHENGQEKTKLLIRSYSHRNFSDKSPIKAQAAVKRSNQQANHVDIFRVKVAFGEDKIRFSLPPRWGFKDLQEEVLRRFNIDNGSSVNLKYLDDDAEWVLLTCDADLEECMDIHISSNSRTIKLSVNQAYHPHLEVHSVVMGHSTEVAFYFHVFLKWI
ncbi:hypothetical protein DH2020_023685 [Rehmannia glutinosa]|uniref:Uncharacterized protein n=1 Tax=Rehmannia glutinosa TaxID=99300 RepID=A0ABR0WAN9_REHGL